MLIGSHLEIEDNEEVKGKVLYFPAKIFTLLLAGLRSKDLASGSRLHIKG